MPANTQTHLVYKNNPKRYWLALLLMGALSLVGCFMYTDAMADIMKPARLNVLRFLTPFIWLFTLHAAYKCWQSYLLELHITNDVISWGVKNNPTQINWCDVRALVEIDLASMSKQRGWCYEFTSANTSLQLGAPDALYLSDYQITHETMRDLIAAQKLRHGFSFKSIT